MQDDLLSFEDFDDLLDFDEPEEDMLALDEPRKPRPPVATIKPKAHRIAHRTMSDMMVLDGESKDPNEYREEVEEMELDPLVDQELVDAYYHWLEKFNTPMEPHLSFAANGVEPPPPVPNFWVGSLAVQKVHQLRAGATHMDIMHKGKILPGEVLVCDKFGNVKLQNYSPGQRERIMWFNPQTKLPLDEKHVNYSLR